MKVNNCRMVLIVGATISSLVLTSCSLLPTIVGENHESWMWLTIPSFLGAIAFFSGIVADFAAPRPVWFVAFTIAAAWEISFGGFATLENYRDHSFYNSQVVSTREITERMQILADKGSIPRSQQDIGRALENEARVQENVLLAKRGLTLAIPIGLLGLTSAMKSLLLACSSDRGAQSTVAISVETILQSTKATQLSIANSNRFTR